MSRVEYSEILPGETEVALTRMTMLAAVVAGSLRDLEIVSTVHARAHSVGPILDPTAYNRGMRRLDEQAEILAPLLKAARTLAPIVERLQSAERAL